MCSAVTLTRALIFPLLSLAWGHVAQHLPPTPSLQSTRSGNSQGSGNAQVMLRAPILPVCLHLVTRHAEFLFFKTAKLKG